MKFVTPKITMFYIFLDLIIAQLKEYDLPVWIGINVLKEGTWLWTDNSQVEYTSWGFREPDGVNSLILIRSYLYSK